MVSSDIEKLIATGALTPTGVDYDILTDEELEQYITQVGILPFAEDDYEEPSPL